MTDTVVVFAEALVAARRACSLAIEAFTAAVVAAVAAAVAAAPAAITDAWDK
ncbi:TPA: hypothetical protein L2F43_004972 [Escherichia coli O25b:H4-ST131]|nr:hypothetical protein [Escherichia coli O25b:H4-ST131]